MWKADGYGVPAPPDVKQAVLLRYNIPASVWIETGTWHGDTTVFLAQFARHVWTIEPGPSLAQAASLRFADQPNVSVIEGLSETSLDGILAQVSGDVCFWLDGHYSAGDTYQGPVDTPIVAELDIITRHLDRLGHVAVLIDDVRCFDPNVPAYSHYPTRSSLVDWADSHQLTWTIEHDIFAATR